MRGLIVGGRRCGAKAKVRGEEVQCVRSPHRIRDRIRGEPARHEARLKSVRDAGGMPVEVVWGDRVGIDDDPYIAAPEGPIAPELASEEAGPGAV